MEPKASQSCREIQGDFRVLQNGASDEEKLDSDTVILTLIAPSLSGEVSEEKFKAWYDEQGYEFSVLLDPTAETFMEYGIRAFPTSAFITSDGQLYDVQIGHHSNESINETLDSMQ